MFFALVVSGYVHAQPGQWTVAGRVLTQDGVPPGSDAWVELSCSAQTIQTAPVGPGGWFRLDASIERPVLHWDSSSRPACVGRPDCFGGADVFGPPPPAPTSLTACEIQVSAPGFVSRRLTLHGGSADRLGIIVLNRMGERGPMSIDISWLRLPPRARRAFERGLRAHQQGNREGARKWIEATTRAQPDFAAGWIALGVLSMETRQPREAEAYFGKALTLEPKAALAVLWRAVARYVQNDLFGAEADARQAVALGGSVSERAQRLLARIRNPAAGIRE